jgi:hypothetical protein
MTEVLAFERLERSQAASQSPPSNSQQRQPPIPRGSGRSAVVHEPITSEHEVEESCSIGRASLKPFREMLGTRGRLAKQIAESSFFAPECPNVRTWEGLSMIEFDLSGRKVSVTENDLEWLRLRAAKDSGRSTPASELAGRLAAVRDGQRRLVFSRAEARALVSVLDADSQLPASLMALNELLQHMFFA